MPTGTVKHFSVAVSFLMFIQAIQRPPPLVMGGGGTKVLILCKNTFKSEPDVYERCQQSELIKSSGYLLSSGFH